MTLLSAQKTDPALRGRTVARIALAFSGLALVAGLAGCSGTAQVALPGDFPAAVAVPEGTVLAAAKSDGAWTVNLKLDKDDTRQAALEELTGAGFVITGESGAHGNDRVYSLGSDEYSIRLGVTTVDGDDVLSYTVAERHASSE